MNYKGENVAVATGRFEAIFKLQRLSWGDLNCNAIFHLQRLSMGKNSKLL